MVVLVQRLGVHFCFPVPTKKARGKTRALSTASMRRSAAGSLFQLRRRFEAQPLRRLDLDCFARLRIAADARAAFRNAKRAEGSDLIGPAIALCRFESGLY